MAGFVTLNVHIDRGTRKLADELARLKTRRLGMKVSRPDAVHEAIKAAVDEERELARKGRKS